VGGDGIMRDFNTVFQDNLREIGELLGKKDFESAFKSIGAITYYCSLSENELGVFISEVLEGVFSQVGPIFDNFQLPEDDEREFMVKLQNEYSNLIHAISDDNNSVIFEALVSIRYVSTQFQVKWKRIGKQKSGKKGTQIPPTVEEMMKKIIIR
jgi:hypothetical protein